MDEQNKKTVYLSIRIRSIDRALLEALCKRRGWNLSEGIRHAIATAATKEGLYNVSSFILEKESNYE